ncbi:MAG: hypothetical protein ACNA8W_15235 [Bradymonadaceae bacterium]
MAEVLQNVNNLFVPERIAEITSFPEWTSERIEVVRQELEELWEKRHAQIDEGLNDLENQYYWVSYVLRALGYCATAAEPPPSGLEADEYRPDFTLFFSADDFRRAVPHRGEREFFAMGLSVVQVVGWNASLDEIVTEDGSYNPAFDVDRHLRNTGVNFGILTNGRVWRLFHRDTSGLLNTYVEIDLLAALQDNDPETFKYFWTVFSPEGLGGSESAGAIVQRLLN